MSHLKVYLYNHLDDTTPICDHLKDKAPEGIEEKEFNLNHWGTG